MAMPRTLLLWLAALGGAAGCNPQLDLSDKECPCAPAFVCVSEQCVPRALVRDAGPLDAGVDPPAPTRDAGESDAGESDAGLPEGQVRVETFQSDWQTPNSLHWTWTLSGDLSQFNELTLVIAENEDDLRSRSGTARVIDSAERASLGELYRPRVMSGMHLITSVFTDAHTPGTRYVAQLVATDLAGHASRSNIVTTMTNAAPIDGLVLFSDERPTGYPFPGDIAHSMESPYAGTHHLAYEYDCTASLCYEIVRWQDIRSRRLDFWAGNYELAYVEMAVAVDAVEPSFWCVIGVNVGGGADSAWNHEPLVPRQDGAYHIIQFPLHRLGAAGERLDYDTATGDDVTGFRFGCLTPSGTRVRVDEVAIRW